jgi:hypothetical protein
MAITDLIPPEIKNDKLYNALVALGLDTSLHTYIEIGSSSGEGSTEALVSGIRQRKEVNGVRLFCMELSRPRFTKLVANYCDDKFLKPYNLSSVCLKDFPSKIEVSWFYTNTRTNLNAHALEVVLGWLDQDIEYVRESCLDIFGIEIVKSANAIAEFDMAFIDGSEFTGERELLKLLGAKYIVLDDVNAHKNFNSYRILRNHTSYQLFAEDLNLRNGFAIFVRNF